MKLNQATVVAFLSSATVASSAAFSHDEFKDKIAPLLASKHLSLSRVLQLNDGDDLLECIADTIELLSVIDVECPEDLTEEGNTFILDNSVCDPEYTDSITEACAAANGTIVSGYGDIDITADCSIQGFSEAFNMLIKDTPQCMANSCDVSKLDIVKDKLFVERSEIFKTAFSNMLATEQVFGAGAECEVTVNLSGGSPTAAPKENGDDLLECIADTKELESVIDVGCAHLFQEGNNLILDYSSCDPDYSDSITEACTAANGTIVSGYGDIDITADCSIQGTSEAFNILIKDTPQCMANSCDVSKWDIVKDNLFVEYSEIIETEFSNFVAGGECKVTVNLSSSAGKATAMLAFAATSAAAAFFFF